MEAHRKMIHFEIDEVGTQRQNEIEEILEQISPEKNITRDFIDDIEYDSVEFIKAAAKLQSKGNFIKTSDFTFFEVSYFSFFWDTLYDHKPLFQRSRAQNKFSHE